MSKNTSLRELSESEVETLKRIGLGGNIITKSFYVDKVSIPTRRKKKNVSFRKEAYLEIQLTDKGYGKWRHGPNGKLNIKRLVFLTLLQQTTAPLPATMVRHDLQRLTVDRARNLNSRATFSQVSQAITHLIASGIATYT